MDLDKAKKHIDDWFASKTDKELRGLWDKYFPEDLVDVMEEGIPLDKFLIFIPDARKYRHNKMYENAPENLSIIEDEETLLIPERALSLQENPCREEALLRRGACITDKLRHLLNNASEEDLKKWRNELQGS